MRFVITASIGEAGLNMKKIVLSACVLIIASATAEAADTFSGSGVVIGTQGEILTNAHVVEACTEITVRFPPGNLERAGLVARDERNDLAVVRATGANTVATFRDGSPVRAGDAVVALGYPLSGLLATSPSVSIGNVSALAGLLDDSRYLQISAPVQPGNSGGPLLDASGHLIGVVTAKLNAVRVAKFTGDIPQNVNFALKAEVVRTFLDSKGIAYRKAPSDQQLSPADVGDIARPFTVHIECQQGGSQPAAVRTMKIPPPSISAAPPKPYSPPAQFNEEKMAPSHAVDVVNLSWENRPSYYHSFEFVYRFTLRNKTSHSIDRIEYVVIFYDNKGAPIHSEEKSTPVYFSLLGNLVKTIEEDAYLPESIREHVARVEVRVIDYRVSKKASYLPYQ
jgi:Trypsin-like peptidase domain